VPENRLKSVSDGGTFAYDPTGQRTKKVENGITTYYFFGCYEEEWQNDAVIKATKYYFANGMRIAERSITDGLRYYHADHLGSSTAITNADGSQVLLSTGYTPYGSSAYSTGSATIKYQYTGQEKDACGLMYYNARYYDPELGRFIQPDTMLDGLNRYTYCGGNPIVYSDPSGHFIVELAIAIGAVAGMYLGGVLTNNGNWNPLGWDWNSPNTYTGMIIGGIAGGMLGGLVGCFLDSAIGIGGCSLSLSASQGGIGFNLSLSIGGTTGATTVVMGAVATGGGTGAAIAATICGSLELGQMASELSRSRYWLNVGRGPMPRPQIEAEVDPLFPEITLYPYDTGWCDQNGIYHDSDDWYVKVPDKSSRLNLVRDIPRSQWNWHHICTDKNLKSGEQWTIQFINILQSADINIKTSYLNIVPVSGHSGPHPPAYHSQVYDRLIDATDRFISGSMGYKMAVYFTLNQLAHECRTSGFYLNLLITGGIPNDD
jgi:RHS repeat-associated protein